MQERMKVAADLIREKRYEEAQMLLRTVDHPRAKEWLKKLDDKYGKSNKRKQWVLMTIIAVSMVVLIVAVVALINARGGFSSQPQSAVVAAAPTVEPSPVQQVVATPDCGAYEWWQFAAPSVYEYMENLRGAVGELKDLFALQRQLAYADSELLVFDLYQENMNEAETAFENREYPLCAKDVYDAIRSALTGYMLYIYDKKFQLVGSADLVYGNPEDNILPARIALLRAHGYIQQWTGDNDRTWLQDKIEVGQLTVGLGAITRETLSGGTPTPYGAN